MLRNSQHAAVRHLESSGGPEFSEGQRLAGGGNYADGRQVVEQLVSAPSSHGPDEHFGERELVHPKPVSRALLQEVGRTRVVPIVRIEESDDDAGVEYDHAGQSVRRASR
jgi:hypothetical protein